MPRRFVPARGDAVWVSFNPQAGHEQAGRRPALVVSPAAYLERQRDPETGGWKYVVAGSTLVDHAIEVVGRLSLLGSWLSSRSIVRKRATTTCDLCGAKTARIHRVTRSYGRGRQLLIVEKVPILRCSSCGGSYLTAATLHELDRIKSHRGVVATKRRVPIARFVAA